jgi:chaperonin GroES
MTRGSRIEEKVKYRPIGDRVFVKRDDAEEVSKGGIIIPDRAKEKALRGTVVAVGPGARNKEGTLIPMEVEVGDVVLFTRYGGADIDAAEDDVIAMRETDILAVIED